MTTTNRFCKDCIHSSEMLEYFVGGGWHWAPACMRESAPIVDPVDGPSLRIVKVLARRERQGRSLWDFLLGRERCGPEGRFFERSDYAQQEIISGDTKIVGPTGPLEEDDDDIS